MSLFKNRSGGSLYRFKALEGYMKLLYEKYFMNGSSQQPSIPTGELQNKMVARFVVNDQETEDIAK